MLERGVACDLICIGQSPLHTVPLLKYKEEQLYAVPHWVYISFYDPNLQTLREKGQFIPNCRMPGAIPTYFEVKQQQNSNLIVPIMLSPIYYEKSRPSNHHYQIYDDNVFRKALVNSNLRIQSGQLQEFNTPISRADSFHQSSSFDEKIIEEYQFIYLFFFLIKFF